MIRVRPSHRGARVARAARGDVLALREADADAPTCRSGSSRPNENAPARRRHRRGLWPIT
jgi:hypothetical protein